MIKRLLNPHILLKITLILTTLLLLPTSSWAGTFSTKNDINNTDPYTWGYGGGSWTITTSNAELLFNGQSSISSLKASISNGGNIKLSTTNPTPSESGERLSSIRIQGEAEDYSISFRFQKKDGSVIEESIPYKEAEYRYTFEEYLEWEDSQLLEIIISDTGNSASCNISSIILHTKSCSSATFAWPDNPTSEYDVKGLNKTITNGAVKLEGHCMNNTVFSFPLQTKDALTETPSITYTSSNPAAFVVDESGRVTVNATSKAETTITAKIEDTSSYFFEPSSYSYTLHITGLDYGLIVGGVTVNSANKGNITGGDISSGTITFDETDNTLTLENATLTSSIISYLDKLTIDIQGNNSITTNGEPAIKTTLSDSSPTLTIKSTSNPVGSLILKNTKSGENCGGVVSEKFGLTIDPSISTLAPYYGEGCIRQDTTHVASFGESYNLAIDMVRVGNTNASDIWGNHKASYNKAEHTLTLNGISITNKIEKTIAEDLTIALNGENNITVNSGAAISAVVAAGADMQPTLSFVLAEGATNAKLTMTNGANDVSSVTGFTWHESDSGIYVLREYGETTKKTIVTSTLFSGGDGTKDNPFIISNLQDFKDFVYYLNNGNGINPPICAAYFKLENDIDCASFTDFSPINGGDRPFMGSFDGNGKTISNLTYDTEYTSGYVGVFYSVRSGGVVKNLTLQNCSFTGGVSAGSIAGYLEGSISNCTINNCTISTGNAQSPDAGGVAGYIYGGSIENCKVSGSTINAQPTGDAGWISGNNGVATAGGIGGKLLPSETSGIITSCEVSNSNISASHPNSIDHLGAGGIVAYCSQGGTISNNTVKGTTKISSKDFSTSSSGYACAGAIVGKKGSGTFTNNTYEYTVTTEEENTKTQSVPTTKSGYDHRGIGEKTYNEIFKTYESSPDIFEDNAVVLANIKKVTLTQNDDDVSGGIWLKESYKRDLGEDKYEEYIVVGQETVIGVETGSLVSVASFTVTTSTNETVSTRIDNEAIGDGVTAYVFTMPNDNVTAHAVFGINIAEATVSLANNQTGFTYTGGKKSPVISSVEVVEEIDDPETTPYSVTLTNNDYTVSYKTVNGTTEIDINADDIVNVGSYKMILTGKGDYFGTKEIPFQIKAQAISGPITITLSATSLTYNGEVQKPTITEVSFTQETVDSGDPFKVTTTNYDATYSDGCTNADTYTVSVSLKGNYSGEGSTTFEITKASITPKVTIEGWTYGTTANTPSVTGNTGNGEVTYAYKMQNEAESAFADTVPTNAGAYTVKASIAATANYEAASDTAQFIIAKATPTLSFSATTASLTMDEEVTGLPTLSNPSGLAVTYTSSNSEVATISEDGTVTPVAPGETTISATIATSNNYEGISASYVLTVNKSKRYGLKVGDTEVTEDNKNDILGDGDLDANKRPTFLFNPTDTTLLVINSEEGLTIESRLPELKIHLTGEKNKLKSIIFNNQDNTENIGKLIFTSDDAFPGKVTIANTAGESAIRGFESISFAEICKLLILSPEEAVYQNGTIGADTVIIGQLINPMTNGTTVTFNNDDFTVINPDGTQEEADLSSYTSNEIHYTLPGTTDGQGYDASTNTITVIDAMNDEEVQKIAKAAKDNTTTVGSGEYAQQFIGLTFMVAGGEGDIEIDQEVIPGYAFHLKIGEDTPKALGEGVAGRLLAKEHYKVDAATYCWLYLVENAVAASRAVARKWGDTRVGKRDRMHGAIYSVSVKPNKVKSANPPSQASGGVIPAAEGDKIETEGIQGVKVVNTVDDRWFTIDGRQIDKPTQKGLYIHNRKKVVVK